MHVSICSKHITMLKYRFLLLYDTTARSVLVIRKL
jgi:hypothetical protein